ncbi:hypothetical protein [Arthrobacter citreus]|uniref:hypothetical protein n=1 Tax=Arthrobacter citreus TaxID=1670 RepID=UPI0036D97257
MDRDQGQPRDQDAGADGNGEDSSPTEASSPEAERALDAEPVVEPVVEPGQAAGATPETGQAPDTEPAAEPVVEPGQAAGATPETGQAPTAADQEPENVTTPEPGSAPAQGTGFAVPGGFDAGPSLPYGTDQAPPVPPYNPYAAVPGAPSGTGGGEHPGQPGQAPFTNPSGYPGFANQGAAGSQGHAGGNPGYQGQGYQGQPGPYGNQGANSGQPGYQGQPGYPGQPGPYQGQPGYPGQPGPYQGQPYGNYAPPSTPGKGLAIAALVLGILSLLVCWIPFVNVITFPLAIVSVGLGIPALIKGIKAKNIAKPLSIAALSVAVVTIVAAIVVNSLFVGSLRDAGLWESETEAGTESYTETEDYSEELLEAEQEDYSYEYSDTYISGLVSEPSNSAGEEVTVGDYTVTLTELDRDAAAEVQERDPNAGAPDHNYVIARFSAVYNGSGDGRPWLDLPAELIGTDNRIYSVLGCSSSLGQRSVDQELLSTGDSVTVERCFDVPDGALGEDSRLAMRMILAEENNDEVYFRLP